MTDNEIIKALEYCINNNTCKGCLYSGKDCYIPLKKNSLDLIIRQQAQLVDERAKIEICAETISRQDAEIERLQNVLAISRKETKRYATRRAEAIKEFAEKVKEIISNSLYQYWNDCSGEYYLAKDVRDDIDNLVNEMVGKAV